MNTYSILAPVYTFAHTAKPPAPAKPFDVFDLSWETVGTVKAPTVEAALRYAKKLGHRAPAVELAPVKQAGLPASQPSAKAAQRTKELA